MLIALHNNYYGVFLRRPMLASTRARSYICVLRVYLSRKLITCSNSHSLYFSLSVVFCYTVQTIGIRVSLVSCYGLT